MLRNGTDGSLVRSLTGETAGADIGHYHDIRILLGNGTTVCGF